MLLMSLTWTSTLTTLPSLTKEKKNWEGREDSPGFVSLYIVSFTETTMPTNASKHFVDRQTFFCCCCCCCFWITLYFVVLKVLSYQTAEVFLIAIVKYLHELLHPYQQHLPLKPPYWKLCLRETNFDSFWDAPIDSLCRYDEGCSHLFLPCITET